MEIIIRENGQIRPYANNPRNNDGAVDAVAASIREFGWQQPIVVDKDGVIIAGHKPCLYGRKGSEDQWMRGRNYRRPKKPCRKPKARTCGATWLNSSAGKSGD